MVFDEIAVFLGNFLTNDGDDEDNDDDHDFGLLNAFHQKVKNLFKHENYQFE